MSLHGRYLEDECYITLFRQFCLVLLPVRNDIFLGVSKSSSPIVLTPDLAQLVGETGTLLSCNRELAEKTANAN